MVVVGTDAKRLTTQIRIRATRAQSAINRLISITKRKRPDNKTLKDIGRNLQDSLKDISYIAGILDDVT